MGYTSARTQRAEERLSAAADNFRPVFKILSYRGNDWTRRIDHNVAGCA